MDESGRRDGRWALTLFGGAVVAGVVVALSESVRRSVLLVETRIDSLWIAGKRLAQNTQALHLLAPLRASTARLRATPSEQSPPERTS
jgi:hypothetical protein